MRSKQFVSKKKKKTWNWDIVINKPDYGKVSESCAWTLEAIFDCDNEVGIKFYQISVKSGYHLAQQISRVSDRTEWSTGVFGSCIWSKIWRLHLPKKKIKVFMWRTCKNILPTHVNSIKWRVISEDTCEACKQFLRQVFIFFGNVVLHRMYELAALFSCRNVF